MADLVPYPFGALVTRTFRELAACGSVFDLPAPAFFRGDPVHDFTVEFHGRRASHPLGPAAGPQTQLAQNIALSWLAGCRIFELKTVQVRDDLTIGRPCIDMQTVGYNVEWSQELKLEESFEEYVKAAMLITMLKMHEATAPLPGFGRTQYDMSVGYDLAGIRSPKVQSFIRGMLDARATIDRLRYEVPLRHKHLRDLDFPTQLSDSVTLSTFHGCPPREIERIIEFLMREFALDCVVKLNPMLLGPEETRALLHDALGYEEIRVPDSAFERDTTWPQAVEIVGRLSRLAASLGLGFGVKLTNTLIVENDRGFVAPSEPEAYLSGPPLHVLAMRLTRRFRHEFGAALPISFSAGVDRKNFPDAVALGLVPITVCSDLLKPRGYGRLAGYHQELITRMAARNARTVDEFVIRAYGLGEVALDRLGLADDDPRLAAGRRWLESGERIPDAIDADLRDRWVAEAALINTDHYVARVIGDPRYSRDANTRTPRKIGRFLRLFDCITCDKCIPVCPNDANFALGSGPEELPAVRLRRTDRTGHWEWDVTGGLALREEHQIATFADFCNACGNCDIFCPEDGGPYLIKPLFFGTEQGWRRDRERDGFYVERAGAGDRMLGRIDGAEYELRIGDDRVTFRGAGFEIAFEQDDPAGTVVGDGPDEIDLTPYHIMDYLRRSVFERSRVNPVNALWSGG